MLDCSPNSLLFFKPLLLQEGIRDKLRPISLAITHTIKSVPPRRHSGSKRLEKLAPVLNVSPSNTIPYEVWNEQQTNQRKQNKRFSNRISVKGRCLKAAYWTEVLCNVFRMRDVCERNENVFVNKNE